MSFRPREIDAIRARREALARAIEGLGIQRADGAKAGYCVTLKNGELIVDLQRGKGKTSIRTHELDEWLWEVKSALDALYPGVEIVPGARLVLPALPQELPV